MKTFESLYINNDAAEDVIILTEYWYTRYYATLHRTGTVNRCESLAVGR